MALALDRIMSKLESYASMSTMTSTDARECQSITDQLIMALQHTEKGEIDIDHILQAINTINMVLVHTTNTAEKSEIQVEVLKIDLENLKTKVDQLEKEINELRSVILFGQIACKFEKALLKEILTGTSGENKYKRLTFRQVKEAIKYEEDLMAPDLFNTKEEREQSNQKWSELNSTYDVTSEMYGVIENIKRSRNTTAHPKMSIQEAYKALQEYHYNIPKWKMDTYKKMLDILNNLKEKNLSY